MNIKKIIILATVFLFQLQNTFAYTLSNTSVAENNLSPTTIGSFSDLSGSYSFVSGPGDDDNSKFLIDNVNKTLTTTEVFDYDNPQDANTDNSYEIRVETTVPFNLQGATFPLTYNETKNPTANAIVNENGDAYYGSFYSGDNMPNNFAFAVLKPDGSVTAWGDSNTGGTGAPTGEYERIFSNGCAFTAMKRVPNKGYSLTSWGGATCGGSNAPTSQGFYTNVYSTNSAFAALKSDGTIVAWGDSNYGGTGAPTDGGYEKIYSNAGAFVAVKEKGGVTCWGDSDYCKNVPTNIGSGAKVYASSAAFAALKSDGTIVAWGDSNYGGTGAPKTGVYSKIFANSRAFTAVSVVPNKGYSLISWGDSLYGGGSAPAGNSYTNVYATRGTFAALDASGSIAQWGSGSTTLPPTISTPTDSGYTKIYSNNDAFVATKADGTVSCWGFLSYCVDVPASVEVGSRIYATSSAFAVLTPNGSITAWGDSNNGGTGEPTDQGYVDIYSNNKSFVAIKADGTAYCWGDSNYGGSCPKTSSIVENFIVDVTDVDDTAPSAPITAPDLQSLSDTGVSDTDNYTSDNTPTFDVVCSEVGSTINLYFTTANGSSFVNLGSTNCTAIGTTSVTATVMTIPDGTWNIVYTETDALGNQSQYSPALSIVVNTSSSSSSGSGTGSSSGAGGAIVYVCKDENALNYSSFGRHKQSLCAYETSQTDPISISEPTANNPFSGQQCTQNLIITDNMKNGDTNGKYSIYNKGVVTQISILQLHINRLLQDEYGYQAAGPVDDYFRSLTKRGVERLQRKLNTILEGKIVPLVIDGIVGPFTKAAINMSC